VKLQHASLSDIGCRRKKNEDAQAFAQCDECSGTYLMVVADGVGGNVSGERASELAVETIQKEFQWACPTEEPGAALRDAIMIANRVICRESDEDPAHSGMATTCTAMVIQGGALIIGHVGDCRGYLAREDALTQLTDDHTVAAEYERQGKDITGNKTDLENTLTRCLGLKAEVEVDVGHKADLVVGDGLVVCSDGLTKVVSDEEILQQVQSSSADEACRRLVDLARERGGPDNITVHVAKLIPS
jgi:protein phosphatase